MEHLEIRATAAVPVEKRGYTCAEAMGYLGLKRRAFEKHIRPRLPSPTPCGTTRLFERSDLARAWEEYRAAQSEDCRRGRGAHE